jgi:hypothetical protein
VGESVITHGDRVWTQACVVARSRTATACGWLRRLPVGADRRGLVGGQATSTESRRTTAAMGSPLSCDSALRALSREHAAAGARQGAWTLESPDHRAVDLHIRDAAPYPFSDDCYVEQCVVDSPSTPSGRRTLRTSRRRVRRPESCLG